MSKKCTTCNGAGVVPDGVDLKDVRDAANLTQASFAEACGWSGAYQSDMERGNRKVSAASWAKAKTVEKKDLAARLARRRAVAS